MLRWSNFIHQSLNYLMIVIGLVEFALYRAGCVAAPSGYDCSASLIPPEYAVLILGILALIKQALNWARDGLGSIVKVQPKIPASAETVIK